MAIDREQHAAPNDTAEQIYQLGHAVFTIKNCDDRYKQDLEKLLPHLDGQPPQSIEEVETGCSRQVLELIRQIVNLHHKQKCVWIEGICLIAASGQKILLVGKTQSGKSTTAMALALRDKWKILSENFCIIDYAQNKLLKFLTPASLDSRALELLKTLGVVPAGTIPLEWRKDRVWAPLDDTISESQFEPMFDFAFFLERTEEDQQAFSQEKISASEFGRKALALSNLLKIQGSYDSFTQSLSNASCHRLSGGELTERLDAIVRSVS